MSTLVQLSFASAISRASGAAARTAATRSASPSPPSFSFRSSRPAAARAASVADGDHRRLVEHDALAAHVDQRVGGAQVDCEVGREIAAEGFEHVSGIRQPAGPAALPRGAAGAGGGSGRSAMRCRAGAARATGSAAYGRAASRTGEVGVGGCASWADPQRLPARVRRGSQEAVHSKQSTAPHNPTTSAAVLIRLLANKRRIIPDRSRQTAAPACHDLQRPALPDPAQPCP